MVKSVDSTEIVNFAKIEKKWQNAWEKAKCFEVLEDKKKKKFYVLEMYPYPSASFLHMGHVRNYTIGDVYARFKRMFGFNVLYPIGYDSFGLPAETAAKKEGIHPKKYSEQSIKKIMEYQKALGNSYDWSRVIASHEPQYYRWNQFFFLKLFEKGLAYRKNAPVNWCEKCESVLANEESEGGKCWRCGSEVIKKNLEQWFFKITAYADKLLNDLKNIDWPEKIKTMQENWIGRSEGTEIVFKINNKPWNVFTTRPDTLFGVTFLVVSAQHPNLMSLVAEKQKKEVEKFLNKLKSSNREDVDLMEKEGVFTGSYAIHPLTNEKIPVYAGNFVVADYGSGMVMAVPAHDERDFAFAQKYKIPIKVVIKPEEKDIQGITMDEAYTEAGKLVNSEGFNDLFSEEAKTHITKALESKNLGKSVVQYKLRDWLVSRQRYWGTPIPIIHCDKCGIVPVPEKDLPVLLPEKVDFDSKSNPLASNKQFLNVKCPKCSGKARRETDTMGGFVDSSWYFLRYCDSQNKNNPFDENKVNYWMPVNQYIGGAEHAVMHLMYSRFFIKALKDLGFVKFDEPFAKLFNQGIVYKDGAKMSKSKGNVVYQTDISDRYGIDTTRLFLMFVSSPDKQMEWSDEGVEGAFRFINKLIKLKENLLEKANEKEESKINSLVRKVSIGIDTLDYPKAIVPLFEAASYFAENGISREGYETILKLTSPFCPHITEELWAKLKNKGFISLAEWPKYDEKKINEKFDLEDKAMEKTFLDISNIIKIVKEKQNKEVEKVYLYVLPNELGMYNSEKLESKFSSSISVKVFAVNDKNKYDPTNKSKNSKPGKPAIFAE